jgi:sortase (surface protein transpeptidase)
VFGLGVLAGLRDTQVGQVLQLRAGKQLIRYRIVQRRQVRQAQLARGTDAFRQDVPARLVVITCGGPFNRVTHRYQDNLMVVASVLP